MNNSMTVSYLITRGQPDAAVAVDVYGLASGPEPVWVNLKFDPGKDEYSYPKETRRELASKVYAFDAPIDQAYRERYVNKTADAVAGLVEQLSLKQAKTNQQFESLNSDKDKLRARFASYLLRSKLELFLEKINFSVTWTDFTLKEIEPFVSTAIEESSDDNLLQSYLKRDLPGHVKIDNWLPGYSEALHAQKFNDTCQSHILENVALYGIVPTKGQSVWRVRFNLTTQQDNIELWSSLIHAPGSSENSENQGDDSPGTEFDGAADQEPARHSASSMQQGNLVVEMWKSTRTHQRSIQTESREEQRFSFSDVHGDIKFEHGVIFVHGIGPHKTRETLTKFGEPFLESWSRLLAAATGVTKERARDLTSGCHTYKEFEHNARYSSLINRTDLHGATHIVDAFKNNESPCPPEGFVCGSVRVKDTISKRDSSQNNMPPSSLVQLSSIYGDYSMREANVILSEAHWTDQVISYSFDELGAWLFDAFPIVLASQFNLHRRAMLSEARMASKMQSVVSKLVVFALSMPKAFFHLLMLPVVITGLMILQPLLYVLLFIRIIPIGPLQSAINKLVSILAGTVGQSQVLIQSPIRRNAIVASVTRDIDKVLEYCDTVTVVAHSQGAEVARLVAGSRDWERVSRWVTFGPGITPLNNLRQDFNELSDDSFDARSESRLVKTKSSKLIRRIFALSTLLLSGLALSYYFDELVSARVPMMWAFAALVAIAIVPADFLRKSLRSHAPTTVFSAAALGRTRNYYASHDPVPDGPVFSESDLQNLWSRGHRYMEQEIFNRHSVFQDHTTYLKNVEEFVSRVGIDIAMLAGFLPKAARHSKTDEKPASQQQVEQRCRISWWKSCATFYFYLTSVASLIYLQVTAGLFSNWSAEFQQTFAAAEGFWNTSVAIVEGPLKNALFDIRYLVVSMAVFYILRKIVFSSWFGSNQLELYKNLAREKVLNKKRVRK